MNVTSYVADFISQATPSSLPLLLWKYYLEYLWFYEPTSWVYRIAYSFRVLAFMLILPVTVLTLLDIASYVVARTLGVVDDVKVSTDEKSVIHSDSSTPIVVIDDTSTTNASLFSSTVLELDTSSHGDSGEATSGHDKSQKFKIDVEPQAYFVSEENNLKLSGVGVFSPATSRPSSPAVSRRHVQSRTYSTEAQTSTHEEEGTHLRKGL